MVTKQRRSGATAGVVDKYYISSSGIVARSMIEVGKIEDGYLADP